MSRVFISSTYQDLIEHHKAVTDVLTRMKQEYSSMEFFGSRTDEAVLACEKEIETSSFLVGIYAWRYGWIPPENTRSITEQEFDYARTLDKKCLCYRILWGSGHVKQLKIIGIYLKSMFKRGL